MWVWLCENLFVCVCLCVFVRVCMWLYLSVFVWISKSVCVIVCKCVRMSVCVGIVWVCSVLGVASIPCLLHEDFIFHLHLDFQLDFGASVRSCPLPSILTLHTIMYIPMYVCVFHSHFHAALTTFQKKVHIWMHSKVHTLAHGHVIPREYHGFSWLDYNSKS